MLPWLFIPLCLFLISGKGVLEFICGNCLGVEFRNCIVQISELHSHFHFTVVDFDFFELGFFLRLKRGCFSSEGPYLLEQFLFITALFFGVFLENEVLDSRILHLSFSFDWYNLIGLSDILLLRALQNLSNSIVCAFQTKTKNSGLSISCCLT